MGSPYWEGAGATKTFTHPLYSPWIDPIPRSSVVLDYGCGYGRITAQLKGRGFADVFGVDPSTALVARGRTEEEGRPIHVMSHPPAIPAPSATFDMALLFTVLTSVPDPGAQGGIVGELTRLLKPGALLYVSDILMSRDPMVRQRYDRGAAGMPYGSFTTRDGGVFRHHRHRDLRALFSGFAVIDERALILPTMNGNPSRVIQMLLRHPGGEDACPVSTPKRRSGPVDAAQRWAVRYGTPRV